MGKFKWKLLLFLSSLLIALICAEIFVRYRFQKSLNSVFFSEKHLYYTTDPTGVRHHIPNSVGFERLWNDQGLAEVQINSFGFRGPEIQVEKPHGTVRILFIGDSITLGGRLHEKDVFVHRIQEKFNDLGQNIEAINAGMGDIGIEQIQAILMGSGLKINPDIVVYLWYLNDNRPPVGFPEERIYSNSVIKFINNQSLLKRSYLVGLLYEKLRQSILKKTLQTSNIASRRFQWTDKYNSNLWQINSSEFSKLVDTRRD